MTPHSAGVHQAGVHQTVSYGSRTLDRRSLLAGLGFLAFGVVATMAEERALQLAAWLLLAIGAGLVAYALHRLHGGGEPLLVLSPEGVRLAATPDDVVVPWPEVAGVEALDIETASNARLPMQVHLRDVTALRVSRGFYDRAIAGDRALRSGVLWRDTFVADDGAVLVALHHHVLPVPPAALRAAVEARWRAFGGVAAARAPAGGPRRSVVAARGTSFKQAMLVLAAIVAAVLIAEYLGAFELPWVQEVLRWLD